MNNLQKTCACLLTTAMCVGLGFSSHYLAMDEEKMPDNSNQASVGDWDEQTEVLKYKHNDRFEKLRKIIKKDFFEGKKYASEELYILSLQGEQPWKFMIVNSDVTKCIEVDIIRGKSCLKDVPKGYGNECYTSMRHGIQWLQYHEVYRDCTNANVFDEEDLPKLLKSLPEANDKIRQIAKEKGIAGYKKDPTWWSYCVAF